VTPQKPQEPRSGTGSNAQEWEGADAQKDAKKARSRRISVIDIPAPCKLLNTNQRHHRMEKAKLTKAWRKAGEKAAYHTPPFEGQVHITAHIIKPRGGRWDPNNYWDTVKPLVDGLVDAGVLRDDDWEHVIGPDHRRGGKGEARVILTIEQL